MTPEQISDKIRALKEACNELASQFERETGLKVEVLNIEVYRPEGTYIPG